MRNDDKIKRDIYFFKPDKTGFKWRAVVSCYKPSNEFRLGH
jgi:hypothetical protein